jgi:hypothetical protein
MTRKKTENCETLKKKLGQINHTYYYSQTNAKTVNPTCALKISGHLSSAGDIFVQLVFTSR